MPNENLLCWEMPVKVVSGDSRRNEVGEDGGEAMGDMMMLTCRPLRFANVPAYDSISDSPIHGLSFRPIPMASCSNGGSSKTIPSQASRFGRSVLDDPLFQHKGTYDHGDRAK